MFRNMRRTERLLPGADATAVLDSCTSGVLAVQGDEGYPYAIPLSFAREGDRIFFHSAPGGYKLEAVERNEKVCFCVIARDEVVPSDFLTHYRSVIVFGRARILTGEADKKHALRCIAQKYSADYMEEADGLIEQALPDVCVMELTIEHITGRKSPDPAD